MSRAVKLQVKHLARRLAGPVTAPLDGRVADINRRVSDTSQRVDRLEAAVTTFAEASTEASSYVGVELDRTAGRLLSLERSMRELAADAQEAHYRSRIADAVHLSLSDLEGDLAEVINHSAGYRGFAAQADLWFNPPLTVELAEGAARLAGSNERIAEMPFAMMALGRLSSGARILDVGSAESTFPLSAASLGFSVTAVEPRGLPYEHPNLETVAALFDDLPAPEQRYDAVFLISTIEHVGLSAYGNRPHGTVLPGSGADRDVLTRAATELLTPEGIIVVTTPYGESQTTDFERTYDDASLERLFEGWEILQRVNVARHGALEWSVLPQGAAVDQDGVAMIVARPVAA